MSAVAERPSKAASAGSWSELRSKISWILEVWRPLRHWAAVLCLFTLVSTATTVAYPYLVGAVIDAVKEALVAKDSAASRAWTLLGALVAVGIGRFIATYYPAYRAHVNHRIEVQVRETLFQRMLLKSESFFARFRTGDLLTRLTDDLTDYPKIGWFCCSGIFRAFNSLCRLVACFIMMLALNPKLTLIALAPFPLMLSLFFMVKRRLGERIQAQRAAISATNDILEASFVGIRVIKAHTAEDRQAEALRSQLAERSVAEMDVVHLNQLVHGFYQSLSVSGQVIVVTLGGLAVLRGEMAAGVFYAFFLYLDQLVEPLLDLPTLFVTGKQAFVCIDRVEEARQAESESEGGAFQGQAEIDSFDSLRLCKLSASYPSAEGRPGPLVLRELDLQIRAGERLAIVGRLGSGKSTLLRLILGSCLPAGGEIRWNDHPAAEMLGRSIRQKIGVVSQQPQLVSESIAENITFGRPYDEDWLRQVVDAAGLTHEIAGFPQGIETRLGQDGLRLSGGQRQRVAIARALYGRPQLLLLDDLTSALDAENERRLWKKIDSLLGEVAILCITHRAATAQAMGQIAVLEQGQLVDTGEHSELAERCAVYRELHAESASLAASS